MNERTTDERTNKQTNKQTNRQTNKVTNKQTKPTNTRARAHTHAHKHACMQSVTDLSDPLLAELSAAGKLKPPQWCNGTLIPADKMEVNSSLAPAWWVGLFLAGDVGDLGPLLAALFTVFHFDSPVSHVPNKKGQWRQPGGCASERVSESE